MTFGQVFGHRLPPRLTNDLWRPGRADRVTPRTGRESWSMKKLAAELFGTFALVFAGTGAIVIDDTTGGAVTHVGVAMTFGLVVLAAIYSLGDVSGAHLN